MSMRIFSILFLCLCLALPSTAGAISIVSFPFGGKIIFQFFCTCEIPGTSVLYVYRAPASVTVAKFIPYFSTLYELYAPYYGANIVGKYTINPVGQCSYYAGTSCSTFNVKNKIQMIGTSLPFGL